MLAPLYSLLQKKLNGRGTKNKKKLFRRLKIYPVLSLLTHYDPDKPLILACDASPWGVEAVLSQLLEDGCEHPVAYTSRSLVPAKKYSQIDKEGLAIIFGVQHFNHYLLVRSFTIYSYHKPLQYLFNDKRNSCYGHCMNPEMGSEHTITRYNTSRARIFLMLTCLVVYHYQIVQ